MTMLRVPKALMDRAENLAEVGVEELAWRPEDANDVLEHLKGTSVAILGGDIYTRRSGRFESTYENWYVDRDPQEAPGEYAARTVQMARSYVEKLKQRATDQQWVVFVFSEPIEPADVEGET